MKKILLSVSLIFAGVCVFAQQDAQFTQNMFNKLAVNPGSAGHNGGICGTLLTRQQWTGFEGNPQTHLFSGDARFRNHGIGLTVFQDELGVEKSFAAKVAYAYHLTIPGLPGTLSAGVEVGYSGKSLTADNFVSTSNPSFDPSIPNENASDGNLDVGVGLYYKIPGKLYVGISALHLPNFSFEDNASGNGLSEVGGLNYEQVRNYYIMGGYEWDIKNNQQFVLKPSFLTKTDATSTQLDVNLLLEYNNKFWGGVTYRLEDAIGILAGVNLGAATGQSYLNGLKIGAAYDITTSSISDHSNGSVELFIRYCTSITPQPVQQKYHSVRFL